MPLRLNPNIACSTETSLFVARELDGVLEYLEDPTGTIAGMAEVAEPAPMPLAANMCVISFETLRPGIEQGAVGVVLSGRHYRGGLRRTRELAAVCETFGIGVSTHSNFHLGIGLAAMTHVAAVVPNLTYACDTHYPWNGQDDIVVPGVLEFVDGGVPVPTGPGLGVEPDQDAPAARHRTFLEAGRERRDDTGYMRRVDPAYDLTLPRW
ncbi:enolase C-terminal domain-like protein [Streptomyces sp. NPDC088554]|uniref:enolase C-terminal domain-like protein n=1 Tax=Streptomyces sp. NPDC088554 TaxID=3365865 RepID=UPI0038008BC5